MSLSLLVQAVGAAAVVVWTGGYGIPEDEFLPLMVTRIASGFMVVLHLLAALSMWPEVKKRPVPPSMSFAAQDDGRRKRARSACREDGR
jgi:hypothetical protein